MNGRIIKGIAGFYYVYAPEKEAVYECKAKGIFRNQKIKPLVGDAVIIDTENQPEGKGTVVQILPRKNELIRPAAANVDQALIVFAAAQPDPNLNLLDRFLIMMQRLQINAVICFNKADIVTEEKITLLRNTYRSCGCRVLFTSMLREEGVNRLFPELDGKTTVLAGPSGVGKSTFINLIQPEANMETGEISEKVKRGRHTTRHSELIYIKQDTYLMDTPGFTSFYLDGIEKDELKHYFFEFQEYEERCRFIGCNHLNEPYCAVKEALTDQKISRLRYESYVMLYEELMSRRRY